MTIKYLLQDGYGNSGTYLQVTQGETIKVKVFLLKADGTPFVYTAVLSELAVAIYTSVSTSPIAKLLSEEDVITLDSTDPEGILGFEFELTPEETASIVANSSGVPILAILTDEDDKKLEINLLEALQVDAPVVIVGP